MDSVRNLFLYPFKNQPQVQVLNASANPINANSFLSSAPMKPGLRPPSTGISPRTPISIAKEALKKPSFILSFLALIAAVCLVYKNHYDNPFHFDDDHTIVTNRWIRQIDSFPKYFTDATTTSSLPRNQAYRPGVTLLHAIDYNLSVDTTSEKAKLSLDSAQAPWQRRAKIDQMLVPTTHTFHVHIFIGFVLSGFLLFLVLLHLFSQALPEGKWNAWLALFGMGWFWLHTANAETINYISARSDSASTFWILLTFVVYFYSAFARKFHLYLLPMIIGFFIKEPAIMFAPLVLFYIALFSKEEKPLRKNLWTIGLSFLTAIILFKISRSFTPTTWDSGGTDPWHYLLTEAFVIVHYCFNFILPVNLSADTDWTPVTSAFDDRVLIGTVFIGTLIYIVVRCWKKREWRPVSFGIIWFFIALAPTSSIFPFAEVLNDHRTYFPYIGLIIAVTWTIGMCLSKILESNSTVRVVVAGAAIVLLSINGYGAYVRCHAWSSSFTLWGDCIKKSPGNGRAWMHYGMSLFSKGNKAELEGKKDSSKYWYDSADVCYNRSQQIMPYYSYLMINRGVLRQWQGNNAEAETYYRNALAYDSGNPEAYYFLGDFLRMRGKTDEAFTRAEQGLSLSPDHERLKKLYSMVSAANPFQQAANYEQIVGKEPTADNWLNLSLAYYNSFRYDQCIAAAEKVIQLDSMNVAAWNNICTAENMLGQYEQAIKAGEKALSINGTFVQAQGNMREAIRCKAISDSLIKKMPAKPTADDWLNLSLGYYNSKLYARTIFAAEEALKIRPNDAVAFSNICTACNRLSWYDRAVEAGQKAVQIKPDFVLAKNNLDEAIIGQQSQQKIKQVKGQH